MDSSVIGLKISKKRKKLSSGNPSNNTPKKQKFSRNSDASTELVKEKKPFANKHFKSISSTTGIQNSNKNVESNKSIPVNMGKTLKKKTFKNRDITDSKPQSKQVLKSKKNKKVNKVPSTSIQISPSVSKVKKGKKKLSPNLDENINSASDGELSDICISDDNESDEEILREEIQKSSIFKQIEKLMKKAPHLNPANAGIESAEDLDDETVDNSSDLESDEENSTAESDDQESDMEDSNLKNEASSKKKKNSVEIKNKNILLTNKKATFSETVAENAGFNRNPKISDLRRNISDKEKKGAMSSNLKNKVQEKLAGAKFRFLNEKLYTESGKEAFKYFQDNTEEFEDYHSGYRLQVSKWPMNPVNEIITDIQKLKKSFVIADLGCGEAKIAQTFPGRIVHSFDLVPLNEFVKACDISKIPLPNESVDVVVFCLSLMGTNLKDYLCEAFRILKVGGILKIAEVESRIEDLGRFLNCLRSIGFKLERKNTKHKMFVFLDLKKEKQKCKLGKVPELSLRPCLYKKR